MEKPTSQNDLQETKMCIPPQNMRKRLPNQLLSFGEEDTPPKKRAKPISAKSKNTNEKKMSSPGLSHQGKKIKGVVSKRRFMILDRPIWMCTCHRRKCRNCGLCFEYHCRCSSTGPNQENDQLSQKPPTSTYNRLPNAWLESPQPFQALGAINPIQSSVHPMFGGPGWKYADIHPAIHGSSSYADPPSFILPNRIPDVWQSNVPHYSTSLGSSFPYPGFLCEKSISSSSTLQTSLSSLSSPTKHLLSAHNRNVYSSSDGAMNLPTVKPQMHPPTKQVLFFINFFWINLFNYDL